MEGEVALLASCGRSAMKGEVALLASCGRSAMNQFALLASCGGSAMKGELVAADRPASRALSTLHHRRLPG